MADAAAIIEEEPYAAALADKAIALYRLSGEIFAIGDICTHEEVRLSGGWIEDERIVCPKHQSCFEIRTGKVIEGGMAYEDVAAYEVKVEGDCVFVRAKP